MKRESGGGGGGGANDIHPLRCWSSDFGHAETGNGAKKRVVLRREFFSL